MKTTHRNRGVLFIGSLLGLVAAMLLTTGCGGPERAPHQPITGVDRPADTRAPNPHDKPEEAPPETPPSTRNQPVTPLEQPGGAQPMAAPAPVPAGLPGKAGLLSPFVDEIAKTVQKNPGIVAIFPALTRNNALSTVEVNGLGQRLAEETTEALQMQGLNPVSGEELKNDILASNRGLDEFRSVADVFWLADRIGAAYAVYGTVQKKVYDRMARDEQLDIKLQCIQVQNRSSVARLDKRLTSGRMARDLYRDYTQSSSWKIGQAAPPFKPTIGAEVKFATESLVRKIVADHGKALAGKRIAIDPVLIRSVSGSMAGNFQAFTTSFLRCFDKAERDASAKGSTNPEVAALDRGPFTIRGKEYKTLASALEVIESRRAAVRTSPAGELSLDISRALAESFTKAGGTTINILADGLNRTGILNLIKREVRSAQGDGAVDQDTIQELRMKGAQLLVRSTFRPFMRSYQFRIMVLDVNTGKVITSSSIDFDPRFKPDLDTLTTS